MGRGHIGRVNTAGDLQSPSSTDSSLPVEEILSPVSEEVFILVPEDSEMVSSKALYERLVTLVRVNL